jgi:hypothetical protein
MAWNLKSHYDHVCMNRWESPNERDHSEDRCRWEDGIRVDFREIGLGGVECIQLAHVRHWWQALVHMMMSLWVFVPQTLLVS